MARGGVNLPGMIFLVLWPCYYGALHAAAQKTHPQEENALLSVRDSLDDPYGHLDDWGKGDPCTSNWTGIFCESNTTDGYRHVNELRLLNMNLSGILAPELGKLSQLTIMNFMWNDITGEIPGQIGSLSKLKFLLVSGNRISGSLPDELGNLTNLKIFQINFNYISGSLPRSFANLVNCEHFHMSNNSISGQIPVELSTLPKLKHFILSENSLSGDLPPEFSRMPKLTILQLDNNRFEGSQIPESYGNMSALLKLSLRNCSLKGGIPDLIGIKSLRYLDLSWNQLTGSIPTEQISDNMTTIDLSYNELGGPIPSSFSRFPKLQKLSLRNNSMTGSIPSDMWSHINTNARQLTLDFQNNLFTNISDNFDPPSNVSVNLQGNPVCDNAAELNIVEFCGNVTGTDEGFVSLINVTNTCESHSCKDDGYSEFFPNSCNCSEPLGIGFLLLSPTISDFIPYAEAFELWMTTNLGLKSDQLYVGGLLWENGPRLRMSLKIFPPQPSEAFRSTTVLKLVNDVATFSINGSDIFGPYTVLNFSLGPYSYVFPDGGGQSNSGISKAALVGSILGAFFGAAIIALVVVLIVRKKYPRRWSERSKEKERTQVLKIPAKIEGVKEFSFKELEAATNSFDIIAEIGHGGYGRVFKGCLADGTVVAVKRAQAGSLQGQKEFITEIELLSRVHHRNLVSLVGYCFEEGEQILVYEFMPNGSLSDLISPRSKQTLGFAARLRIALGAAKGILYLHTEADPPIIHRDVKANNILIDSKYMAKVSDFGISKLAPLPDEVEVKTPHISTFVKGTPGYLDPEYLLTRNLTVKSDVYSLGIVFLELLTGMQPIHHGKNIVREVTIACQSGMMLSIIDRRMGSYRSDSVKRFMSLALNCCNDETTRRPTMLEVVRELEDISSALSETDPTSSEQDALTSRRSSPPISLAYSRRDAITTSESHGSDLDSAVFPTIRPR